MGISMVTMNIAFQFPIIEQDMGNRIWVDSPMEE